MAAKYSLQPNEVVFLKDESVMHGGFWSAYTDELMLTNLNLVLIKKGLFGNSKGITTFPVNQIKVYNQQAQAVIGKATNGSDLLEVYFLNGQEKFAFQSGGKKKLTEWIAKIHQAVTGEEAPAPQNTGRALPGAEMVAGVLKDTLDVFKSKLATKPATPMKVAGKCRGCGAPMAGVQGQTIICSYCDSAQQL
ncbi:hypothetical protein M2390_001384 [Mycetocola sp. BIGb0189]|uniref:hypothetical protein n=1 Tax=Mycetocola sp. BIGb0189 TaxID=2940604 RepID=UPI002167BB4F|nr:hypothetical protein [Mycetocola sp. BIGb0189]MCS4276212.1 hypothetical protein [Mycetocola sp. BIGb0189]